MPGIADPLKRAVCVMRDDMTSVSPDFQAAVVPPKKRKMQN